MNIHKTTTYVLSLFMFLIATVFPSQSSSIDRKAQIPFDDARIIIEFNSTDDDVGIQLFLDGEAWQKVTIFNPNGNKILDVFGRGRLSGLGLTELFFESDEPSLDEMPLQDFLALFPEGEYRFTGTTVEGETLEGVATFTHNIPDGPSIVAPERRAVVDPKKAVIRWDPVITPAGIQISGYQVIVESGRPLRILSIDLPATATSVKIPPEFLEPGTNYQFEILAKEAGGNQTISQRAFRTQ